MTKKFRHNFIIFLSKIENAFSCLGMIFDNAFLNLRDCALSAFIL